MNIILNGQTLHYPLTGIGWYTRHLLRGLQIHSVINQLVCIPAVSENAKLKHQKHPDFFLQSKLKKIIKLLPGSYTTLNFYRNNLFKIKSKNLINKKFIYHEPCYILRPYAGLKVCTIHDLSHIHYPQHHPKERVNFLLRHLPRSIDDANHIITGSKFIRSEIINSFNILPNKVTSIYHGVSKEFRPRQFNEVSTVLTHYSLLGKSYLLSVGTLEPRKNLERLIQAFNRLSEQTRKKHPLVLVGIKGWNTHRLERIIQSLIKKEQLYCLGYVPSLDIPYLYSGAYGFLYLSLYEGFGLPLLEAMASGIPTLASNASAIPEVVGNATMLTNPLDIDMISGKLNQLINDLPLRDRLKQQGPLQAVKFSWESCIENTIAVYRQTLKHSGSS